MSRNLCALIFLNLCAVLAGCHYTRVTASKESLNQDPSAIDLGQKGNQAVVDSFNNYLKKSGGCKASGNGKRVIFTGFGLFEGVSGNISGTVAVNLSNSDFWPQKANLDNMVFPAKVTPVTAQLTDQDYGGKSFNRSLSIENQDYEVCFLLLDVSWDLSAAIIVHEMESFQPQLLVMSGLGASDAVIESVASNYGSAISGYEANGKTDPDNRPVDSQVLPSSDTGVQAQVNMTWDSQKLLAVVQPQITALGFQTDAPAGPDSNNDYICNDVSFVAREALIAPTLHLAGGLLTLTPKITSQPIIGFFHYPLKATLDTESLKSWSQVMAAIISNALAQ